MRHLIRGEIQPMLGARQPSRRLQPDIERRRWEGRQLSENGQACGPLAKLIERPPRYAWRVVVQSEYEGSDREQVAPGKPLQYHAVLARFDEILVHVVQIGRVYGLHADKDPLAAR